MKKILPDKRTIMFFTGGPGTGKSGTASRFLKYMNNPDIVSVSYDAIKEKNWDIFGFDNEAQKDRINWWCLEEYYLTLQKIMWENKTILTEYPFYQRHKDKLKELIDYSGYHAVTVFLYTDPETVYKRAVKRDGNGYRHPGHLLNSYHKETFKPEDLKSEERIAPGFEEFTQAIAHKEYNIALGHVIKIDVTDFSVINYDDIFKEICENIK